MDNQITVLNNQEILGRQFTVYGDINEPLFLAKDVAQMIENKNVSQMLNVVEDDEKVIYNVYTPGGNQDMWFLTEDGLYEVLMQSRKPIAKQFKKEIKAILKQLRRTGVVITESATSEAIDYESKYGARRIRRTFRDSKDLESTWNEFKELSQIERTAKRLTGKESINRCNQIIDELTKVKSENITKWPYYKHALYDAMIVNVLEERQRLSSKTNGGIKSGKTKQINKLAQENVLLKEENDQWQTYAEQLEEYYNPQRTWYELPIHGFSTNFMFDENHNATRDYKIWLNKFPKALLPTRKELEAQGVCLNKRNVVMEIGFIHCEPYDVDNLVKSLVDVIFGHHLHINDNLIIKVIPSTIATCDNTSQGEIHFCIYNTDEVPHINSDTLYRVVNGRVELLNNDEE